VTGIPLLSALESDMRIAKRDEGKPGAVHAVRIQSVTPPSPSSSTFPFQTFTRSGELVHECQSGSEMAGVAKVQDR
jgi:hypothetical protein